MISAVIPVYNEAASLPQLHSELSAVAATRAEEFELLFVDDGSTDDSWQVINQLADQDARVRGIRLRRNFGKAAALDAGFQAAQGTIVFSLDADLQDDPREIPHFLEKLAEGYDVVSGWKQVRHDPLEKRLPSKLFNWLVSSLTNVHLHDHNCGFKCYRRAVFDEVRLYGELHRFVPVLAAARGWKIGELVVQHRARQHGKSKYGWARYLRGFLDLLTVRFLTGYGSRPAHFLGTFGILCFLIGLVGNTYAGLYWVWSQLHPEAHLAPLHQRPIALYSWGCLLFGVQLLSIGFLAELITAQARGAATWYAIREQTTAPENLPSAQPTTASRSASTSPRQEGSAT